MAEGNDVTGVDENGLQRPKISDTFPEGGFDLRWRLANGELPLAERHLRSLAAMGVGAALSAWMRTRLEYVLENHAPEYPNGTLHIVMDDQGKATFSVEPLPEEPAVTESDLVERDGQVVGAGRGVLWMVDDVGKTLTAVTDAEQLLDATATTVRDLAKTLRYEVAQGPVSRDELLSAGHQAFVTDDEFGVLTLQGNGGAQVDKFRTLLDKVLRPPKK